MFVFGRKNTEGWRLSPSDEALTDIGCRKPVKDSIY